MQKNRLNHLMAAVAIASTAAAVVMPTQAAPVPSVSNLVAEPKEAAPPPPPAVQSMESMGVTSAEPKEAAPPPPPAAEPMKVAVRSKRGWKTGPTTA